MRAVVAIAVASLALAACGPDAPVEPKVSAEDVQRETAEAARVTSQYASQEAEAFARQAGDELAQLETQIAELRKKAEAAGAETRERLEPQIAALEEKAQAARGEIARLEKASGEAWESAKAGVSKAMDDLEAGYRDAAKAFESG